ncbi:MAG: HlyC/CorC family transporter [Caldilineaceae bacterium]|nr:HlyC/CorC family transporter [Caldilineaceae bacterium]
MIEILIPILIIVFLIVVNGIFVAAEFGIAASPRARVAQIAEGGSAAAQRVLEILRQPSLLNRYISTAQIGITIASLGLGMYGEHAVADWLIGPLEHWGWLGVAAAHTVATILSVAILTYLHVVVGEMVPKSIALQSPSRAAIGLTPVMTVAERIFLPLTWLLNTIGDALLRLFGLTADAGTRLISSAELEYIVEESTEGGLLDPTEQIFLENVIDFSERTVFQVMTPRTRMVALPVSATLAEVMEILREQQHSRYPVYEEDRDHIVGILHLKDLARKLQRLSPSRAEETFDLRQTLRPAFFVPETLALEQMLDYFRKEHIQIAIAVDEFGGTAGLVTLEDLVEEIIGEIQDESDFEIAPFAEIGERLLRVRGDLLLDELNQHYGLDLEHEDAETVGGLIMDALGHMAEIGESVTYAGVRFEVESTEGLAVETALVYLPTSIDEIESAAESDHDQEDDSTLRDTVVQEIVDDLKEETPPRVVQDTTD